MIILGAIIGTLLALGILYFGTDGELHHKREDNHNV
jgi:hypothetical protein